MQNIKQIIVFYDYFTPAFKAGGPIQSLQNLVDFLRPASTFAVITGARDKGEESLLPGVVPDTWNERDSGLRIFYWRRGISNLPVLLRALRQAGDSIIYINGLYSPYFTLLPLLFFKGRIIVAPRGMLHGGALSQKTWKKKLYLSFFRFCRWHQKVCFHATDSEEADNIRKVFGVASRVKVAPNIPKRLPVLPLLAKEKGQLSLVSIALIGPMKNIDLVLQALLQVKGRVDYHIYGPVSDILYWNRCLEIIAGMPDNIRVVYHGALPPDAVGGALAGSHVFILPSKSENFGHAIFESLSAGKPVVTSHHTPWKQLEAKVAGWNVATDAGAITMLLHQLVAMEADEYSRYREGASRLAADYIDQARFREQYEDLFYAKS